MTSVDSGKLDDLIADPQVNLAYYKDSSREYVSISGLAHVTQDKALIHQLYKPDWKAWLGDEGGDRNGGPDDPRIALIEVKANSATTSASASPASSPSSSSRPPSSPATLPTSATSAKSTARSWRRAKRGTSLRFRQAAATQSLRSRAAPHFEQKRIGLQGTRLYWALAQAGQNFVKRRFIHVIKATAGSAMMRTGGIANQVNPRNKIAAPTTNRGCQRRFASKLPRRSNTSPAMPSRSQTAMKTGNERSDIAVGCIVRRR